MAYPQNLRRTSIDRSDTEPLRPSTDSFVFSEHKADTYPMASSIPPPSLAQRSPNPSILPRGDSLNQAPRRADTIPPNPIPSKSPQAFYIPPKPPSRQRTTSTAISDSPQSSIATYHSEKTMPKPPQSAIVTTTSVTQTRSSSRSSHHDFHSTPISRQNSIPAYQTTYMKMLLGLEKISKLDNILIAFFNWIILAGFLIFPATYVSLEQASKSTTIQSNATARAAVTAIQHVPLLVMAYICCGIGCLGIFWLWWKLRLNYVWLCNKIFFTICLNSLAGLVSTLISVYGQKGGYWSVQAMITACVTGGVCGIAGILYLLYNFVFLAQVKKRHDAYMAKIGVVV